MRKFKVVHDKEHPSLDYEQIKDYFKVGQILSLWDSKIKHQYTVFEFSECRGKFFLSTHFMEVSDEHKKQATST